jgi:uncharacterized membrane protein YczE
MTSTAPTIAPVASRWRASPARLVRLLVGLWVFGTGEAILVHVALGNGPWLVLAEGVSLQTPLSIGVATQVIGVLVLLGWIPLRERPGLGTICNVILIGVAIDVMLPVLPGPGSLVARFAGLVGGVALIGLGSGLYLTAALGPGPRDGWMTGLHRRFGWPLSAVRMGIELTVMLGGWWLGGTVGLGTVAFAVLIGPAVGVAVRLLGKPGTGLHVPPGVPRA